MQIMLAVTTLQKNVYSIKGWILGNKVYNYDRQTDRGGVGVGG